MSFSSSVTVTETGVLGRAGSLMMGVVLYWKRIITVSELG